MVALIEKSSTSSGRDLRPDLREEIHGALGGAIIHAEIACRCAEIGDDIGLAYQLRRFLACAKAALMTGGDLAAIKSKGGAQ